jgi:hypothetical protein
MVNIIYMFSEVIARSAKKLCCRKKAIKFRCGERWRRTKRRGSRKVPTLMSFSRSGSNMNFLQWSPSLSSSDSRLCIHVKCTTFTDAIDSHAYLKGQFHEIFWYTFFSSINSVLFLIITCENFFHIASHLPLYLPYNLFPIKTKFLNHLC